MTCYDWSVWAAIIGSFIVGSIRNINLRGRLRAAEDAVRYLTNKEAGEKILREYIKLIGKNPLAYMYRKDGYVGNIWDRLTPEEFEKQVYDPALAAYCKQKHTEKEK